jgi:uncharacterized protein YraI
MGFALVVPAAASAETAYTTKLINLRAGPSRDYELVLQIPAGAPVEVYGCVDDWSWCDVSLGEARGWVYSGNLVYPYQNQRVVVLNNGPVIGFPIVTFSVGPYWDTHYRGRPWYSRRTYWAQRPPPARAVRPPEPHRSHQPAVVRPPVNQPHSQPPPPHPHGDRPEQAKPQSQPQHQHGGKPEAAKPQPQSAHPAPAKQPENKAKPQHHEEHKPGGN